MKVFDPDSTANLTVSNVVMKQGIIPFMLYGNENEIIFVAVAFGMSPQQRDEANKNCKTASFAM